MPSDTIGLNLSQMADLQRTFDAKASEIEQLIAQISTLVGTTGAPGSVHWQGQLAEQFRSEWDGVFVKNLRQLVAALQQQARYIDDSRRRSNLVLNGIDA